MPAAWPRAYMLGGATFGATARLRPLMPVPGSQQIERSAPAGVAAAQPPQHALLGVPLALTDYERTLDWIDAAVRTRAARLHLRRRRPHGDGLARGPRAARRRARRELHGARRPAARVGAQRARARPARPRLRPRADGPRLRARRRAPASASTSTAAATTARWPSSRARCACATRACRSSAATARRSAPLTDAEEDAVAREINRSRADVVWVGIGVPKQEKWMARDARRGSTRRC